MGIEGCDASGPPLTKRNAYAMLCRGRDAIPMIGNLDAGALAVGAALFLVLFGAIVFTSNLAAPLAPAPVYVADDVIARGEAAVMGSWNRDEYAMFRKATLLRLRRIERNQEEILRKLGGREVEQK